MKGIDLKVYGTAPSGALLVSADEVNVGVQSLIDENAQLQQRANELEAQVELLRSAALNAISFMAGGEAKAQLRDAYDATPAQCLAEIKAEAAASAVRSSLRTFGNADLSEDEIKRLANEYANTIHKQKGGE